MSPPAALLTPARHRFAPALIEALQAAGVHVAALGQSGADPDDPARLIAEAEAQLGPVQVLVTLAQGLGLGLGADTALSTDRAGLTRHMDANLYRPLALAQSFARALSPSARGLILYVADAPLLDPPLVDPGDAPFSATLSLQALGTLTRMLAVTLAPRIRVNLIAPGPVLPVLAPAASRHPLELSPEGKRALAQAVRYIVGAEAVTGQLLALDLHTPVHPSEDLPSTDKKG